MGGLLRRVDDRVAIAVSNVAGAAIAWLWFHRSDWSDRVIDPEERQQARAAEELVEYGDSIEAN